MNKEELYDLIERYLDGTLPETEHQAVERQMAIDADFGAEVELHRALHTSLGDAGNLRLRAALDNLLTNSVYRFRLVACNSAGTTYGMERRLSTGHRIATWGEAGFSPLGTIWPPQDIGEVWNRSR